ncbi:MAG: DNA recombination protein RmuC [Hyphomicrobiaceae bacterium]|nr:DNA recombination protein RmuC [Hyphomicrobiaceae bacterium]
MSNIQDQTFGNFTHWLAAYLQSADGQVAVVGVGVAIVMALAVAVVLAGARRRRQSRDEMRDMRSVAENQFAEIKGRLTAMAEVSAQRQMEQAQVLTQSMEGFGRRFSESLLDTQRQTGDTVARMSERIDSLQRHLAQTLDGVTNRVGDSLAAEGRRTSESLSTLNERLAVIDDARQSLAHLSSEVISLQGVLSNKQARGAFGQVRMETIIRDALPAGAYEFQPTLSNGKRPDCVIKLPNTPAPLVVDSKFPLEGFEALRVARSAEETKAANTAIREAVGRHIDDIAEKYLIAGETQDTALMFVPSESIYGDLHEHFSDLVQRAHRSRIVIVAPNILMLAVQTVQAVIKDVRMRDQAGLIQREVGFLLGDVARLADRVNELEKHFQLAVKALEKLDTSAGKITSRGERIRSLELVESPAATVPETPLLKAGE